MSSDYDQWLDKDLELFHGNNDDEPTEQYWDDEPFIEPNNDYDNYDGWDDR